MNTARCPPARSADAAEWRISDRPDGSVLAAILREVLALRADVAVLASRLPPGDEGDAALPDLLRAIYDAVGARAFTTSELLAHATLVAELRAGILGAIRVPNARRLGKLLSRLEGHNVDGHTVRRIGADSTGAIWSVRRV